MIHMFPEASCKLNEMANDLGLAAYLDHMWRLRDEAHGARCAALRRHRAMPPKAQGKFTAFQRAPKPKPVAVRRIGAIPCSAR